MKKFLPSFTLGDSVKVLDCRIVDDYIILFSAFRYALGRSTYVVSTVAQTLVRSWYTMVPEQRRMFQKEVREAIERGRAGMDMDVREWQRILELSVEDES